MAKKNEKVSVVAIDGGFTWKFKDGEEVTLLVSDFPEPIQTHFGVHGMRQKFSDAYAGAKTVDEAFAFFQKAVEACKNNLWGTRVAGEPREEPIEILARAAAIVKYGTTMAEEKFSEVLEKMKAWDKKKRDSYRRVPDIMIEIARIKAAKVTTPAPNLDEI